MPLDREWGIGAAGSAFEWHSKGRGFESHMLHEAENLDFEVFRFFARLFFLSHQAEGAV